MNKLLLREIVYQKINHPNNVDYIRKLQKMLDDNSFTMRDVANSMKTMYPPEVFKKMNPSISLHPACDVVFRWIGDRFAQLLSNGYFYYQGQAYDPIEIEDVIFNSIKDEYETQN